MEPIITHNPNPIFFTDVSDLGLDLSTPASEIPSDCMDSNSQFSISSENTLNMVNSVNLTRSNSDRQSYYQASPSTGKTYSLQLCNVSNYYSMLHLLLPYRHIKS